MHLLIIRHAIAEDRDSFAGSGKSDDLRPLTDEGRAKMELGAAGLRALLPDITLLAASPLTRAQQTAEIVGKEYGLEIGATTDSLRPRRRSRISHPGSPNGGPRTSSPSWGTSLI